MQRYGLWTALCCVLLFGCRPEAPRVARQPDATTPTLADYKIGQPLVHGNLTIFPITSHQTRRADRFITLDEGLKAGTVKVFEIGAEDSAPNQMLNDGAPNSPNPQASASPQLPLNTSDENVAPGSDDPFAVDPQAEDPRAVTPQPPAVEETETADASAAQPPAPQEQQTAQDSEQQAVANLNYENVEQFDLQIQQGNFQGGGREVNRLMVVNTSDKPLYLMPGEVIIGGSQDRTIGQELVIAPSGEPVAVDVFCVEHERWNDRAVEETVMQLEVASQGALGGSIAVEENANADEAAAEIAKGKFVASVGNLNKNARLALQKSGDQSKVWEEVAVQNASAKVAGTGATFTHNYADADFVAQLEPYIEAMRDPVAGQENVVGVIVAVDGKLESMDMFESTPLFKKLWPKLLKSYALDAATQAAGESSDDAKPITAVSVADAQAFFTKATSGEVTKTESSGDLAVTARESDDVICFTSRQLIAAEEIEADAAPSDASGGFGGGVHVSAFAH